MTKNKLNILGIIPARSGSKRLPKKNEMQIGGLSLLERSINSANKSKYINRLIFSTESIEYINLVKKLNIEIPFVRPASLAEDSSSSWDVVRHAVNFMDNKKKFIPLKVSAPFHCSLMKSAAEKMKDKIESIDFKIPDFEIICNVTSKAEKDPSKIKNLLVDQIFSTVRWRESIINMFDSKVSDFIEIGPGKVLSGMAKRTLKNINCFSINSIDDMKKTIDELKK